MPVLYRVTQRSHNTYGVLGIYFGRVYTKKQQLFVGEIYSFLKNKKKPWAGYEIKGALQHVFFNAEKSPSENKKLPSDPPTFKTSGFFKSWSLTNQKFVKTSVRNWHFPENLTRTWSFIENSRFHRKLPVSSKTPGFIENYRFHRKLPVSSITPGFVVKLSRDV